MNKDNVRQYLTTKLKATHYQQVENYTFLYNKEIELVIEDYQDKFIFTPRFLVNGLFTSHKTTCNKDKCSKKWLYELVEEILNQLDNIKFIYGDLNNE